MCDEQPKDYLTVVYDEKKIPRTTYPLDLAGQLVDRFNLKPGMSLLDVGCGRGEMLVAFGEKGISCQGIDIVANAGPEKDILKCNVAKDIYPFENDSFDIVFVKSVLEHIAEPAFMLDEIKRILKPSGVLILLTPDWSKLWRVFYEDPTHIHPYVPKSVEALLAMHGYENVVAERFCHHKLVWHSRFYHWLASAFQMFVPVEMARRLTDISGIKYFRWSVERQVIACGYKAE